MENVSQQISVRKRKGELLVAAKVIRPEALLQALQLVRKSNVSLGQVLTGSGELTERDLQTTIEVQSLINENIISTELGVSALNMAVKSGITLEEAFNRLQQKEIEEQYLLAMDLLQRTTEEDVEEAIHWLRKAADSGHVRAATELSALYSAGTRIEVNLAEAEKYSKLAAMQDDAGSMT